MITEIKLTARRLDLLNQLNIFELPQLVNYYPKKYEDLNSVKLNKDLDNQRVVCVGRVYSEIKHQRIRSNLSKMQFMMEIDNDIYTNEGVTGENIDFDKKYEGIILNLLGRTVVVENIDSAVELAKKNGYSGELSKSLYAVDK